jgi:phage terminase large subunit-like protein
MPTKTKRTVGKVSRGERNIAWIEDKCRIPEGKFVGKPVRLEEFQKEIIRSIYDSPTRRVIISFARKNGKTAISAFLLLLHLCGPEARPNSQLYSAAQSRDQASILFSLAAKIVRMSPELGAYVHVRETAKTLVCGELGSIYKALSADAATAYGLSPVFCVHDELGQVRGSRSELYEALETASAAQEAPLTVIISTQAPNPDDLLSLLIDDAATGADPETKLYLYSAPMELDPFSDEALRCANPAFDHFMNQNEVRKMAADASRMPSRENEFRNLILNQRVEMFAPFIGRSLWESNGAEPEEDWSGYPVYAGLDLASTSDLCALVLVCPINGIWHVRPTFWLPAEGLKEKSRADRVSYDLWAEQGLLQTTPNAAVEYSYIAARLKTLFDELDIRKIAFDRWNWKHLEPWLRRAELSEEQIERFEEFGQGFQSMSPALRTLETELLGKKLRHGMHPVLTWNAANAVIESDPTGARKLSKRKSRGRIDGMQALAMAVAVGSTAEEAGGNISEAISAMGIWMR